MPIKSLRRRRALAQALATGILTLLATLPTSGSLAAERSGPLRVAVISDLNGAYGTIGYGDNVHGAVNRIIDLRPDLVISTGDMIAAQLRDPTGREEIPDMWAAFHEAVTTPLENAGIPLAVTPGNHDASAYDKYSAERAVYAREWRDRSAGLDLVDGAGFPFNYAFRMRDVLFISLDVTMTGLLPDKDFEWLASLLARQADRYATIVVFSHVPVWPVADGRESEATRDLRLHDLLVSMGVNVYLSGHHHAFYPGVADGIAYISQPCLGSGPRRLSGSTSGVAPRGFTLLGIDGARLRVSALSAPEYRLGLDWSTLPQQMNLDGYLLKRADLADVPVGPMSPTSADHGL